MVYPVSMSAESPAIRLFRQGAGKPQLALGNPWLWDAAAGAAGAEELALISETGSSHWIVTVSSDSLTGFNVI